MYLHVTTSILLKSNDCKLYRCQLRVNFSFCPTTNAIDLQRARSADAALGGKNDNFAAERKAQIVEHVGDGVCACDTWRSLGRYMTTSL